MRRIICFVAILVLVSSCSGLKGHVASDSSSMGQEASRIVNNSRQSDYTFKPGPQFSAELKNKIASQLRALEGSDRNFPIELNESVQEAVEYFLTDARKFMIRSLGRSGRYMPMIRQVLREKGLPDDLAYLALIESGYRVDAVSPARAGGLWQFIPATGRRYGLQVDEWADERMHPVKATYAAADYLADLHKMFGCWYLAAAGYNAGEGKILKGLKKYNVDNFWDIAEQDFLREETKDYVPKFLAAVIIAKDPQRYGLTEIEYEPAEEYDEVWVDSPTDLEVIARLTGSRTSDIEALNQNIRLWCTPLNASKYSVRVPKGTGTVFMAKYAELPVEKRMKISTHVVRSGESLKSIARRYSLSAATLKQFNGLKSYSLKAGQDIKLPLDPRVYLARKQKYEAQMAAQEKQLEKRGNKVVYIVRSGDNPWMIAKRFDLNWKDVARWNNIKDVRKMQTGQKLVIYLEGEPAPDKSKVAKTNPSDNNNTIKETTTYTVKPGDTLLHIAIRYNMSMNQIKFLNNIKGTYIRAGQKLKVAAIDTKSNTTESRKAEIASVEKPAGDKAVSAKKAIPDSKVKEQKTTSAKSPAKNGTYTVQADDTVWRISQRFNTTPEKIREANGLKDNTIKKDDVLKIPGGSSGQTASLREDKKPKEKTVSYQVKDGDTVWKIARLFNVNPDQIRSWNSMKDDNIRPGDILKIVADKS